MSRVAHPAGPRHGDVLPADYPPVPPEDLNALHPAIWPRGAQRSGGVLTIGGIDVRDLAAEFGTPAMIMDEADVRSRAREYVDAFGEDCGDQIGAGREMPVEGRHSLQRVADQVQVMDVEYGLHKPLFIRSLDHELGGREPAVTILTADFELIDVAREWPAEHLS